MSDNSFESILSMISSNPELINKISSTVKDGGGDMEKALSSVVSLISESQGKEAATNSEVSQKVEVRTQENEPQIDTPSRENEILSEVFKKNPDSFLLSFTKSISKNSAFLLALKPYLNKERKDLIDSVVRISQLASIMNLAK
ncbi:MAG: hypothetical protein IJ437_06195 [Clostridia bacterium]|nr:hypothetical protein [Clostridia bacterium]